MKEELYLWIRNLAVFYIFFTAVLNPVSYTHLTLPTKA